MGRRGRRHAAPERQGGGRRNDALRAGGGSRARPVPAQRKARHDVGEGGRVRIDIEAADPAVALARTSSGEIVVAGYTNDNSVPYGMVFARLHPDGSLDRDFGHGGTLVVGTADEAWAMSVVDDDRILAAGCRNCFEDNGRIEVVRLLPNGDLDPGFGDHGVVLTDLARHGDEAWALAVRPSGSFVVAGCTGCADGDDEGAIVQYLPDGEPDPGFGHAGKVVVSEFVGPTRLFAAAIDPQGRVVVAGRGFSPGRYTSAGKLDTTFGDHGFAHTSIDDVSGAGGLGFDSAGRIVVSGGSSDDNGHGSFAVGRFLP